jgi:hypothetical protein
MADGVFMVTSGLAAAYSVPVHKERSGFRPFILLQVRPACALSSASALHQLGHSDWIGYYQHGYYSRLSS